MTTIVTYTNANEYLNENLQFLETEEAINSLIIGLSMSFRSLKNDDALYVSVKKNKEIALTAIKTKGRNFIAYGSKTIDDALIDLLLDYLADKGIEIPGIIATKELATKIADGWKSKTSNSYKVGFNQLTYILEKVNHSPDVPGTMKMATSNDIEFLSKWFHQFLRDTLNEDDEDAAHKMVLKKLEDEEIFLWQDKTAVAMASVGRPTNNGITVNYVYTPLAERRKGYGTKLVAEISKLMLEKGFKFCTLFTILENPTSNGIYQKIGYRVLKEFTQIDIIK